MQNPLPTGLASSSKVDPPFSSTNYTSVAMEHKAKMRENERDVHLNDAKLREVRQPCLFIVL
jgi:hypothetical protein